MGSSELPVELYAETFLMRVGAKLGTMVKIDQTTSIHSRGKFAHLCVEIDLRRKLVLVITALGREFKVQYEGLHMICFKCGRCGHRMEVCIENTMTPVAAATINTTVQTPMEGVEAENLVTVEGSNNSKNNGANNGIQEIIS